MPEPRFGYYFEGPTLAGAVKFQNLLLAFQVVFLIVAGDAGVRHGASFIRSMKKLGLELGKIVASAPASRALRRRQTPFPFPSPQGLHRYSKEPGRFFRAY